MADESRPVSLGDLLQTYDPEPSQRFYARMDARPWLGAATAAPIRRRLRRWGIAAALALVLAASAPPVRAMVAGWFEVGRAASDRVPVAASDPAEAPQQPGWLAALSARVGWTVRLPTALPDGYRFESAVEDAGNEQVIVTYLASQVIDATSGLTATSALTLIESKRNTSLPLIVAPQTAVEPVAVGERGGAYALGAWDSEYDPETDAFVARWRSDLAVANLFWERDGVYYVLITDNPAVSRADLIAAAASVE
ncbi:MAG TPA: hypothetical protein VD886_22630 [Herpetosiphonaceae bacterium]|nr:hypothetical protein [Herpetosiphonaceae bacterium]